jgi:hypothetical protein
MMASREAKRKAWPTQSKLQELVDLGWRNTEIARVTGFSPSAVGRKLQAMGIPPRNASHKDLIWWTVRPEHWHEPLYYGLQAIDNERKGKKLSSQDRYRARVLTDLLASRAGPFVVDYRPEEYPERGFIIVPAIETDTDIVRRPKGENDEQ